MSYRFEIKKRDITKKDKAEVKTKKKNILDHFRKEMGLLMDVPKPGGGTLN